MNNTQNNHDRSQNTHSANCDLCDYVAMATTHVHDDDTAVADLADNLATHNKEVHNLETNSEDIIEAVKAKMKTV